MKYLPSLHIFLATSSTPITKRQTSGFRDLLAECSYNTMLTILQQLQYGYQLFTLNRTSHDIIGIPITRRQTPWLRDSLAECSYNTILTILQQLQYGYQLFTLARTSSDNIGMWDVNTYTDKLSPSDSKTNIPCKSWIVRKYFVIALSDCLIRYGKKWIRFSIRVN